MEVKKEAPDGSGGKGQTTPTTTASESLGYDDFGLPLRRFPTPPAEPANDGPDETQEVASTGTEKIKEPLVPEEGVKQVPTPAEIVGQVDVKNVKEPQVRSQADAAPESKEPQDPNTPKPDSSVQDVQSASADAEAKILESNSQEPHIKKPTEIQDAVATASKSDNAGPQPNEPIKQGHKRDQSLASITSAGTKEPGVSEFSHQQLTTHPEEKKDDGDDEWQEMPSYARYDMYDDDDRLIAREHESDGEEKDVYSGLGGAGRGYTRVQLDEDAQSATSMDDNTKYLFKEASGTAVAGDDEEARDAMSQMQATKDLLTEGQRIAYVGVVRLEIANMIDEMEKLEGTRKIKKELSTASEAFKMWGQKMMIRVYGHMDISEAEQIMIEQLAQHGVRPTDLTPALHTNARVANPMADLDEVSKEKEATSPSDEKVAEVPPPYEENPPPYGNDDSQVPQAQMPSQLPSTAKIDIDLRWTVLCDLFLILIADSVYDARSRTLLERVGKSLDITWIDICRFEKRVTDALEMQQQADKENWNEDEHMEYRRKAALKKRYMMMGLATVGGGLVIGLSAGLLAPVIGAGLAAGFTTIGVAGTSSFLGGVGGAAIITSASAASGSIIGVRAANRRTGAVKTFEYRPLHNNKRVNLIVTVSGWLTGKVDDVRLPFSTVDPIMGDIYSVLWEPDMLRSMGDTIRILATEALTSSIQQILGGTILTALMGALQLPIILSKLSYLIDNPWAVSLDRATAAGKILADSLIDRNLGSRPITLVGYSLGARVIFSCLLELAKRGAYGLIQNVYIFGSPVVVKIEEYTRIRTIVSGRFVNGFNRNDWILGYLFRLTNGGIRRVAGLAAIDECPWVESLDVSDMVKGHMDYRKAIPKLLIECGWSVESEEFTEIEDPDPDNHDQRQRELINEIEEARKQLEKEGKAEKAGKFSIFGRRKKAERAEWEIYEDSAGKDSASSLGDEKASSNHGVLFDIDAIRAELAKEAAHGGREDELQIREIQSTLPPMKLDISAAGLREPLAPSSNLRETRSAEHITLQVAGEPRMPPYSAGPSYANSRSASSSRGFAEEDEVQMTFDTGFDDRRPSPPPPSTNSAVARPEMRTANTLPNITLNDPWGDVDDDDFGKEKEISMTFA